jgi:hypothetical protein
VSRKPMADADRLIFLRICEDRGIEHYAFLQSLMNGERVYPRLAKHFRDADDRYNSGLFHFGEEKSRVEAPRRGGGPVASRRDLYEMTRCLIYISTRNRRSVQPWAWAAVRPRLRPP